MTPTPQQIERDLAGKIMGWKLQSAYKDWESLFSKDDGSGVWTGKFGNPNFLCWSPTTSRDDCAEVLARLTFRQRENVIGFLRSDLCGKTFDSWGWAIAWICLTATPAQITEAVWRATCQ